MYYTHTHTLIPLSTFHSPCSLCLHFRRVCVFSLVIWTLPPTFRFGFDWFSISYCPESDPPLFEKFRFLLLDCHSSLSPHWLYQKVYLFFGRRPIGPLSHSWKFQFHLKTQPPSQCVDGTHVNTRNQRWRLGNYFCLIQQCRHHRTRAEVRRSSKT